jgi:hypothetical protein
MARKAQSSSGKRGRAKGATPAKGAAAAKDWTLTVLVPPRPGGGEIALESATTAVHSAGILGWVFGKEEPIDAASIKGQWTETISGIVATVGEWTEAQSNQWYIEEVTFGLTIGAKGKLLFIAEASAQGSVQVKVKRKPA